MLTRRDYTNALMIASGVSGRPSSYAIENPISEAVRESTAALLRELMERR